MKKVILISLILSSISAYSQENEISINPLNILYKRPVINYERLLNNSHSIGINIGNYFGNEKYEYTPVNPQYYYKQIIRPYHRMYFGKNHSTFYIETHLNFDLFYIYKGEYHIPLQLSEKFRKTGLGIAFGYKYLNSKNYFIQIMGGISKDFNNKDVYENLQGNLSYPASIDFIGGITIGKRF